MSTRQGGRLGRNQSFWYLDLGLPAPSLYESPYSALHPPLSHSWPLGVCLSLPILPPDVPLAAVYFLTVGPRMWGAFFSQRQPVPALHTSDHLVTRVLDTGWSQTRVTRFRCVPSTEKANVMGATWNEGSRGKAPRGNGVGSPHHVLWPTVSMEAASLVPLAWGGPCIRGEVC